MINDTRRDAEAQTVNAVTKLAKKHLAKYEYMMDDSSVPSFFYNKDEMLAIDKETRQKLSQTISSFLEKIRSPTHANIFFGTLNRSPSSWRKIRK